MNNMGKITLIMVAAVAIGAFALPSMLSAGGISHDYVNGTNVDCAKCHKTGDTIANAIAGSDKALYGLAAGGDPDGLNAKSADGYVKGDTIHGNMVNSCKGCHELTGLGTGNTLSPNTHTKVSYPSCVTCHGHVVNQEYGIPTSTDVHSDFQVSANGIDQDAPCIGCHTGSAVVGTITYNMNRATTQVSGLTFG